MIHAQNIKTLPLSGPGTISTAAGVTAMIDTKGFNYATVDTFLRPQASTSASTATKFQALKITESDETNATAATAIAELTGSTETSPTTGFALPTHQDTAEAQVIRLNVDTRGRKRYLFVSVQPPAFSTAVTNNTVFVSANLSRGSEAPATDEARNIALQVNA